VDGLPAHFIVSRFQYADVNPISLLLT
jgi:hypothetical protein